MKPLKGMNQDVSSANMPEGTYRRAQNFIYGKELDALMQEPGLDGVASNIGGGCQIAGLHALPDDGFLVFGYTSGQTDGSGSAIYRWNESTGIASTVLSDDALNFKPGTVLKVAHFQNAAGEISVVFTDGTNPMRILNLESVDSDMTTNKLFPEFDQVDLEIEVGAGNGGFGIGTHFFCVGYEQEDGSRTAWQGLYGPFPVKEEAGVFDISMSNIDTDYPYILIASLSFTGDALEAKVQRRFPASSSTLSRLVDNINPYDELTVAEVTAKQQVYTAAETLAFHENRLYLGNVTEHDEEDLQEYANWIEPIWVFGPTARSGAHHTAEMGEIDYPNNLRFMPGEVYAFYVSWVREDGSETRAFHIPGRPAVANISFTYQPQDSELYSVNTGVTVDPLATNASIRAANANGAFNYLKFDEQAGNTHYYMARDTCGHNSNHYSVGDTDRRRGRLGFWLNQNETYPSDFPAQKRFTWDQGNNEVSVTSTTLAGAKVRHHKIPTDAWICHTTNLDTDNLSSRPTVDVEFEHVPMPSGYVGVRFYHAKRTINNSTVLGQSLLFHGAYNHYSAEATGENLTDYVATNGINSLNNNHTPGGTNSVNGNGMVSVNGLSTQTAWEGQVVVKFGRMHPFDMMRTKPRVSPEAGRYYIRHDYVLGKQAEGYTAFPAPYGSAGTWQHFFTDPANQLAGEDANIRALFDEDNYESAQYRNRLMSFNYMSSDTSFHCPTEPMRIRSVEDVHYLSPGIIDDQREIDNRGGEECLHFKIDYDFSGVDMHYPGDISGEDHYENKLGTTWTGESRAAYTGFWVDNLYSTNSNTSNSSSETPVSVAPITSFCVARTDVYQGYTSQQLVACTPVMATLDDPHFSNDSANKTPTQLATAIAATDADVVSVGKVRFTHTHGDMALSKNRYRTTAWCGWTHHVLNTLSDPRTVTHDYSPDPTAGTIRIAHEVQMYSQANPYYQDNEQVEMDLGQYLGDNDRAVTPDQTNDFSVDLSFLKVNDFRQPGIFDSTESYTNTFPYRIHRSQAQANDEPDINVRQFLAFDSYEMPRNRGTIRNLQGYIDKLLIHHEQSLFVTRGKEKLSTTAGELAFGTGDIFSTVPQEVVPTPSGYGGTQHPLSCLLTPAGYFFVDAAMGKVFRYADKLQEVSAYGMRQYFYEKLTNLSQVSGNDEALFGYHPGVLTVYDPRWNRVILHIRDNAFTEAELPTFSFDSSQNQDDDYYQTNTSQEDAFLSYNLDLNNWTSFHTYNWTGAVGTQNQLYSFNLIQSAGDGTTQLKVYGHNSTKENVGKFAAAGGLQRYDSYIDAVLKYPVGVVFSSVNWYTKAYDHNESTLGFVDHDKTFTHATIYNDYQCSDEVTLVRAVQDRLVDHTANLRRDDYTWKWNDFRDLVSDRTARFIDENGDVISSNIDSNKAWYNQRRIAGNHATVRLRYSNSADSKIGLYLYDIDAKVRKAYR